MRPKRRELLWYLQWLLCSIILTGLRARPLLRIAGQMGNIAEKMRCYSKSLSKTVLFQFVSKKIKNKNKKTLCCFSSQGNLKIYYPTNHALYLYSLLPISITMAPHSNFQRRFFLDAFSLWFSIWIFLKTMKLPSLFGLTCR
jgi:hypothetical protein